MFNSEKSALDLIQDLKWRGLISQSTDETALIKRLDEKPLKYYCGFDPTAPSLHHGNLVQIILLKHLQNAGHIPFCVVGGATGLIGDPRMSGERQMNEKSVTDEWAKKVETQLRKFLSFEGENAATVLNNYDWTSSISAIDFLRDVGKHFRVGTMLSKDTVKSRLNSEEGISFTEFSYQVLQGYDYFILNRDHEIELQTGGQDQWGNLTSGLDLIHKLSQKSVHVLTTPLITKTDGTKFGKSEGGAIWLDPEMMTPHEFYQFWLNVEDEEVEKLLKVFTFLPKEEIEKVVAESKEKPELRLGQKTLASEVTKFVHGENAVQMASSSATVLFGSDSLESLDAETLKNALGGVEEVHFENGQRLSEVFISSSLISSFSDYRRTVEAGGIYVNNKKVTDFNSIIESKDALSGGVFVLRKGKKSLAYAVEKSESGEN